MAKAIRLLAALALAACGSVSGMGDAASSDGVTAVDGAADARVADVDGGEIDAGSEIDAVGVIDAGPPDANCRWTLIASCDTGGTIRDFCPASMPNEAMLERCDGTYYAPTVGYLAYHLCDCTGGPVGTCCEGVSWAQVYCCE